MAKKSDKSDGKKKVNKQGKKAVNGKKGSSAAGATVEARAAFKKSERMESVVKSPSKQVANVVGDPPTIDPPALRITHPGRTEYGAFTGFSPCYSPLTFSLKSAPANVTLDSATGAVTFEPSWSQVNSAGESHEITVEVSDGQGTAEATWLVQVLDEYPCIDPLLGGASAHPNRLCQVGLNASDIEGDDLRWRIVPNSGSLGSIDPVTGVYRWTPGWGDVGQCYNVQVEVYEQSRSSAKAVCGFSVDVVNNLPTAANDVQNPNPAVPGHTVTCKVTAVDDENDALEFSVTNGPGSISVLDPSKPFEATYQWNVPAGQPSGLVDVTVRVAEQNNPEKATLYCEISFNISVQ